MILANFDLSFFTSIPGMLITGGVLLLLIALIIFIATGSKKGSKKNKKDKNNVTPDASNNAEGTIDTNMGDNVVVNSVDVPNTNEVNPTVAPSTVPSTPIVEPSVVDPQTSNESVVSGDSVQPNVDAPVTSNVNIAQPTPVVDTPVNVVDTSSPVVMENANDSINNVVTPDVAVSPMDSNNINANMGGEVSSSPVITIVDDSSDINNDAVVSAKEEEPKSIYGGSSPVIPKIDIDNNAHRPIYGGANPLENTQSIPTINNTSVPTDMNNDVKVDVPTVTATPDVVSAPTEVNNTVVNTLSVDNSVVTPEVVVNENKTPAVDATSKNDEIESLF